MKLYSFVFPVSSLKKKHSKILKNLRNSLTNIYGRYRNVTNLGKISTLHQNICFKLL
jgi:hypothetical protein